MNRIKLSPLASDSLIDAHPEVHSNVQKRIPARRTSETEYSLFVPLHYEKNYAYPLVVWLHSDGQTCSHLQQVMLDLSTRNYVGVAPQAPLGNQRTGFCWDQELETIESSIDSVLESVDMATARCNINSRRIFIGGMGSGGTMAFRLGLSRPDLFAGIMSVNGPMPDRFSPLREWTRCRKIPIFWTHAGSCNRFDQDALCRQLRLLHIAGFSVTLRQYLQGNDVNSQSMADLNRWIMEMISTSIVDR